jgi:hypothetical protein
MGFSYTPGLDIIYMYMHLQAAANTQQQLGSLIFLSE